MRIATFNCENLFARYKFKKNVDPTALDGFSVNDTAFDLLDEDEKKITAEVISDVNADVIALMEVENITILDRFTSKYMKNVGYTESILIDSHDPRGIDVGLLSKHPIISVRTHRNDHSSVISQWPWLFSRDCLEVVIDVDGKLLKLYVNHFKSMLDTKAKNSDEARANTKPKRVEQAKKVVEIVDSEWKDKNYQGNFAVLGDLNDFPDKETSLESLLNHPGLVNVVGRLPADEQWTHFYAKAKEYTQLDYIFLSKSLADKNQGKPEIMRKGIAKKAVNYTGPRFDEVGDVKPVASDHAAVYMDIELE
ncbi:endonuclease/exonuclease/phosphatase family protein [uncultured Methanobacterium sp.]|uniref:endonuclease/exonuclease/phosphatase family protein n=1 Tax=uncultured Methanobacterium sp. TaxID=176306 RepID=UPI002AA7DC64|nr:endonuclease/exonuclease/phosphatase family protein [uncultured Methanobacterium sp.]